MGMVGLRRSGTGNLWRTVSTTDGEAELVETWRTSRGGDQPVRDVGVGDIFERGFDGAAAAEVRWMPDSKRQPHLPTVTTALRVQRPADNSW